jgi:CDP-diacylglycerol--serine O-phosphatidyltransferase
MVAFFILDESLKQNSLPSMLGFTAGFISIFSSLRLAIFNNDTKQTDHFIGVPTPANAFFIIFLAGIFVSENWVTVVSPFLILGFVIFTSFWLLMPVPLIALKFKDFSIAKNWQRYTLIGFGLIALLLWGKLAVPLLVLSYLALSILNNIVTDEKL